MLRRPITHEEAKAWAENLCSRGEYSSGEIRSKLLRKGLSSGIADRIVQGLIDSRFIDDSRFARAFVRDKVGYARWGLRKISAALYTKNIPRDIIAEALEDIDHDTYIEGLVALLKAKLRSLGVDTIDYDTKMRLYRFAASRGFESSAVSRALSLMLNKDE